MVPNLKTLKEITMKFAKTLVSLAVVGAAFSAQADSNIVNGAAVTTPGAVAHLDFKVTIPKVLFLRVGSGTNFSNVATVDLVTFTVPNANVLVPGTAVAGDVAIASRVYGNGGDVTLAATSATTGLDRVGGGSIPWAEITSSTSGALSNPAVGASASLVATGRIVDMNSNWSFSYGNATTRGDGDYLGRITYTATML
jgi:hypothetical protein